MHPPSPRPATPPLRDPALGEVQGEVVCLRSFSAGQAVFYVEKRRGSGVLGSRDFVGIFAAELPSGDFLQASPTFSLSPFCSLDGGQFGGPVTRGNIEIK